MTRDRDDMRAGMCRACGRDLVQTKDRTYHPTDVLPPDQDCAALLYLSTGGTRYRSLNVSPENFIPEDPR